MKNTLPHKHQFKDVAIEQRVDNNVHRGADRDSTTYSGPLPAPMIWLKRCITCNYKFAHDLISKEDIERKRNESTRQVAGRAD